MTTFTADYLLDLLPPIMRQLDTEGHLYDFLSIFVDSLNETHGLIENFKTFTKPTTMPASFMPAMASYLNVNTDGNFTEQQLRGELQRAVSWYKIKGTKTSAEKLIQSFGYEGNLIELYQDPADPESILVEPAVLPATITGVTYITTTEEAGTYTLAFTYAGQTLSWNGGDSVYVGVDGTYILTGATGRTVTITVDSSLLPGTNTVEAIKVSYRYELGIGSLKPDGNMDSLTGWSGLGTASVVLTTTPGEFIIGTAAIKCSKAAGYDYVGLKYIPTTGFVLKQDTISYMRSEWYVRMPDKSKITGVRLKVGNDITGATNWSEWEVKVDASNQLFKSNTWQKIWFNLYDTPVNTSGTLNFEANVNYIEIKFMTTTSSYQDSNFIFDGMSFFSGGRMSPWFKLSLSNPSGQLLNEEVVNQLVNKILEMKPVHAILDVVESYQSLYAYLLLLSEIYSIDRVINITSVVTLSTDQSLPPLIPEPDIITTDIGLMTDAVPYFCDITYSLT